MRLSPVNLQTDFRQHPLLRVSIMLSHKKKTRVRWGEGEIKEAISLVLESILLGITDLPVMTWEEAFASAGYA